MFKTVSGLKGTYVIKTLSCQKMSKKLALIAVCNKLLKQAFAVAKSGLIYDENYRSVLAKI